MSHTRPEKTASSLDARMLQLMRLRWRAMGTPPTQGTQDKRGTLLVRAQMKLDEVAELYRQAIALEGPAGGREPLQ